MTASEFLKEVSPNDNIGIRADLKSANLEKHVIDIMERYAQLQYNQAIRDAAESAEADFILNMPYVKKESITKLLK